LEYLKAKVKDTEKKFGICLLGADTDSISVLKGSHQSLTPAPPGTALEFKVARPGDCAEALPVLMMVGHIGWQIHIHLPVACLLDNERENMLVITPGKLQNGVIFFKELKYLTGVGIGKDIEEFLQVIQALYGKDQSNRLHPTMELQILARYAGYNCTRFALAVLNWVTMGTIMPKGLCSTGDDRWHEPWSSLPKHIWLVMLLRELPLPMS
jgi:hypothetical protein